MNSRHISGLESIIHTMDTNDRRLYCTEVAPIYKSIKTVHFTVRLVSDKQVDFLSSKNEVLCD